MALVLTDEARMVRETALSFFRERSPITALRKLRDDNDPVGFSRGLWREMAELGWTGFLVDEDDGGSGFGMTGLTQVMEAAGRTLTASPLMSTALLGASLLSLAGSDDQKAEYLPPLLAGEQILALALDEGARHAPDRIAATAERDGAGYRLNGEKTFVLDGHIADTLIVAARTDAGVALFLVPGDAVSRTRLTMVDSRNAARIRLDNVAVGPDSMLRRGPALDLALDRARTGLAAEMLGSAQEAFDRTVQYLKDRKPGESGEGIYRATRPARKSSSQAATLRRKRIESLLVAVRRRLCAICFIVVKLAGAWSVRTRHSSSRNIMSITQWRLFSMDQWLRTMGPIRAATMTRDVR